MQIRARFSSTCPRCGRKIAVGSLVEWSQGQKAVHVGCARAAASPGAPAAPQGTPGVAEAPWAVTEKWEPCSRAHLASAVGESRRYQRAPRLRAGAAADSPAHGCYTVVGQAERFESEQDNEDMGDCSGAGWYVTLWLRASTEAEAEADTRGRVGASLAGLGKAIAGMVARGRRAAAEAELERVASAPGGVRCELVYRALLDSATAREELWEEPAPGRSWIARLTIGGESVVASYSYVYDWDLPYVVAGPAAVVGPAAAAEGLVAMGAAIARITRSA